MKMVFGYVARVVLLSFLLILLHIEKIHHCYSPDFPAQLSTRNDQATSTPRIAHQTGSLVACNRHGEFSFLLCHHPAKSESEELS